MGSIVICDDDKNIAVYIEEQVCKIFEEHKVSMQSKIFTNPREALVYCSNNKTDFILLDIDMPEMTGFELSRKLQKLSSDMVPIVIFMSSQEHFVYDAFQYKPFDFLRKSCIGEELESKIERLIREYDYHNEQIPMIRGEEAHVLLKDVLYFKATKNCVEAYLENSNYRCKDKIFDIEEKYPNCLIRTDRQHWVNVNHMLRLRSDYVILSNGDKIPVSRRQKKIVEDKYEKLTRR